MGEENTTYTFTAKIRPEDMETIEAQGLTEEEKLKIEVQKLKEENAQLTADLFNERMNRRYYEGYADGVEAVIDKLKGVK